MKRLLCLPPLLLALTILPARSADSDPTRVLPSGEKPADSRLGKVRTLNDKDFFLRVPATKEAWEARRQAVREQVLVANGLWPLPDKTPLHPVIHGKIDRDDYTIEKVFFASYPGHYVSGNLYRPKGKTGKLPGVLCPHGHWANGRFFEANDKVVAEQIKQGAEKTPEGAQLSAASALRSAGPHGLRRLPLRHGRLRRQHGYRASQRLHRRRGRAAPAKLHGPANLEQHPRPRFPAESAGRGRRAASASPAPAAAARRRSSSAPSTTGRPSPSPPSWCPRPCRAAASARTARICASAPATSSWPACSRRSRWA